MGAPNKACTGRRGLRFARATRFAVEPFAQRGFEFSLLPNIVHVRPAVP